MGDTLSSVTLDRQRHIARKDDWMITPEDAFWLLADASEARNANPYRETRGRCPAHGDHDPGLTFRLSEEGNLLVHCFAQYCTNQAIADAIGVSVGAFFVRGGHSKFATRIPMEWAEMSVLEVAKMVPFGYDFDTRNECVMRTLENGLEYAEVGISTLTNTERHLLAVIWLSPGFKQSMEWHEAEGMFWSAMHELNRDTRTSTLAPVSAIPRRDG